MQITVQYSDYFTPVDILDMLVVLMQTYNFIQALPWFHRLNSDIDQGSLSINFPPIATQRWTGGNDTDDYDSEMDRHRCQKWLH